MAFHRLVVETSKYTTGSTEPWYMQENKVSTMHNEWKHLKPNAVVRSVKVCVNSATFDNKAAAELAVNFLTNFVGNFRCIVHTLAFCFDEVFKPYTQRDIVWTVSIVRQLISINIIIQRNDYMKIN